MQVKTAPDDILEKIRLEVSCDSSARQMIHMSSIIFSEKLTKKKKKKKKKLSRMSSPTVLPSTF